MIDEYWMDDRRWERGVRGVIESGRKVRRNERMIFLVIDECWMDDEGGTG